MTAGTCLSIGTDEGTLCARVETLESEETEHATLAEAFVRPVWSLQKGSAGWSMVHRSIGPRRGAPRLHLRE